ncbi:MAG: hypothetical protein ACHQIG_02995 [Acidimicrobiia bacterium]
MSSLWTPSGEHQPRDDDPRGGSGAGSGQGGDMPFVESLRGTEPDADEMDAEIRRARDELAAVPVVDIIANHAVGLWQLAVLHLTPDPHRDGTPAEPRLTEAALAIDSLAALVDGLGDRLEPHLEALQQALGQLRMAYVQVASGDVGIAEVVDE